MQHGAPAGFAAECGKAGPGYAAAVADAVARVAAGDVVGHRGALGRELDALHQAFAVGLVVGVADACTGDKLQRERDDGAGRCGFDERAEAVALYQRAAKRERLHAVEIVMAGAVEIWGVGPGAKFALGVGLPGGGLVFGEAQREVVELRLQAEAGSDGVGDGGVDGAAGNRGVGIEVDAAIAQGGEIGDDVIVGVTGARVPGLEAAAAAAGAVVAAHHGVPDAGLHATAGGDRRHILDEAVDGGPFDVDLIFSDSNGAAHAQPPGVMP